MKTLLINLWDWLEEYGVGLFIACVITAVLCLCIAFMINTYAEHKKQERDDYARACVAQFVALTNSACPLRDSVNEVIAGQRRQTPIEFMDIKPLKETK